MLNSLFARLVAYLVLALVAVVLSLFLPELISKAVEYLSSLKLYLILSSGALEFIGIGYDSVVINNNRASNSRLSSNSYNIFKPAIKIDSEFSATDKLSIFFEEYKAIKKSIRAITQPTSYQLDKPFDYAGLKKSVAEVNAATVHYSGNCALLSRIVMYNFLNKDGPKISASNTYPIYEGVNYLAVSQYLFGIPLHDIEVEIDNISSLEQQILDCYERTKEQVYVIGVSGYCLPVIGEAGHGHDFNAIVQLDESGKPKVYFVDAWRTSNSMLSTEWLSKQYIAPGVKFEICYCPYKNYLRKFDVVNYSSANNTESMQKALKSPQVQINDNEHAQENSEALVLAQ